MMISMRLFRSFAATLALALVAQAATADELFNTNEAALIEVLKTGEPAAKAIACKKLAVLGTKDSVPLLAPLLDAATRNDERELVFAVLERYPNEHSLRVAKAASAQPELKERAVRVAEAIEQKSPGN